MRPEERIEQREAYARQFPAHVCMDSGKRFHTLVASGPNRVRTKAVKVEVGRAGFDGGVDFLALEFPGVAPASVLVAIEFA